MTSFIPHTPEERAAMLKAIGANTVEELFSAIPNTLKKPFDFKTLPQLGLSEWDLQVQLTETASQNQGTTMESFLGGGAYRRFIPPAVNAIASRSEFYTAYTPYQPEVSQGTLQMIYEFQSMLCELTGMDVANASVYDGAHAVAEASLMAIRCARRNVVYVSKTLNTQFLAVLNTYFEALTAYSYVLFDPTQPLEGQLQHETKQVAAVLVQQPDYYGGIHDHTGLGQWVQANGSLLVVSADAASLAVLQPPGAYGAHIVCGDIQQFGNSVNYGGPYGGFVATTNKWLRQLPGRLVGRTTDKNGTTAYTLTLQTREQHIRREKATSNICTNQSLNVLKASVYMSLLGPEGLKQIVTVSAERAHQLAQGLTQLPGVSLATLQPFLFEFTLTLPIPASEFIGQMAETAGILPGIAVSRYDETQPNTLLVAVTECNSLDSLKRYLKAAQTVLSTPVSSGKGAVSSAVISKNSEQPAATGPQLVAQGGNV